LEETGDAVTQMARDAAARRVPIPELNTAQWERVVLLGGAHAAWMSEALQAVNAFENLRPGWDGRRSTPPRADVLELARRIVVAAARVPDAPAPHVAPVPGGGVQIEWHVGPRDLELEVLPDLMLGYLATDGNEVAQDVARVERASITKALVEWLMR